MRAESLVECTVRPYPSVLVFCTYYWTRGPSSLRVSKSFCGLSECDCQCYCHPRKHVELHVTVLRNLTRQQFNSKRKELHGSWVALLSSFLAREFVAPNIMRGLLLAVDDILPADQDISTL
jgi:hypothetical protein